MLGQKMPPVRTCACSRMVAPQSSSVSSVKCSYCQRSFQTVTERKMHEQQVREQIKDKKKQMFVNINLQVHVYVFQCGGCGTKFASKRNLAKHSHKCSSKSGSGIFPLISTIFLFHIIYSQFSLSYQLFSIFLFHINYFCQMP